MRAANTWFWLAMCAALPGCPKLQLDDGSGAGSGSSTAGAPSASCSTLDGVYQYAYSARSGSCGQLPTAIQQFQAGSAINPPNANCQAGGAVMTTPCTLQLDQYCATSDPITGGLLANTHISGSMSEANGNTYLTGTLTIALTDSTGSSCQGTYDTTLTRIQ